MADIAMKSGGQMMRWNLLPAMRELFRCEPLRDQESPPSSPRARKARVRGFDQPAGKKPGSRSRRAATGTRATPSKS
jgi:hypothetical protein